MKVFLDTSSLVKLYHQEEGTDELLAFLAEGVYEIWLSELTMLEFRSALWKKVRTGELGKNAAVRVMNCFNDDHDKFRWVHLELPITRIALSTIMKYGAKGLRTLILLFFTLIITTVIPCSALELLERDHEHDFTICVGEDFSIRLPGNPTTGYLWEVAANDPAVLKQKGEIVFVADNDRMGAGGQLIFRFVPRGVGSVRLKLVYRRPWEKEIPPIKVFEVVVVVKHWIKQKK